MGRAEHRRHALVCITASALAFLASFVVALAATPGGAR
jgi:hypothetical protein